MDSVVVLEVKHLRVDFSSVEALVDVSLDVGAGEIHAVLGHGGAGKTTLMKFLGGLLSPKTYQAETTVDGRSVKLSQPHRAASCGIAVIPRRSSVFPSLTVAENIGMGRLRSSRNPLFSRRTARRQAEDILRELGVGLDVNTRAGALDASDQQMVTIARGFAGSPRLVVLDEPAESNPAPAQMGRLVRILRLLAGRDIASLYLTADVGEATMVADRITILRDGRTVETVGRSGFDRARLVKAMASREPSRKPGPDDDSSADGLGGIFRSLRIFGVREGDSYSR